jgi:hypothetical protein
MPTRLGSAVERQLRLPGWILTGGERKKCEWKMWGAKDAEREIFATEAERRRKLKLKLK